jgi:hypothetical protein
MLTEAVRRKFEEGSYFRSPFIFGKVLDSNQGLCLATHGKPHETGANLIFLKLI